MLFGNKTPGVLAAEIEMHRQAHSGAFLVLEGKDDMRFWRERRDKHCELVDGEGKPPSSALLSPGPPWIERLGRTAQRSSWMKLPGLSHGDTT